ncbi:flippase [Algiphilus sp.]|uniref:flippase n=1 Tax=Algiphilus sp. TaxID=1872431 RepID=UPI003B529DB0
MKAAGGSAALAFSSKVLTLLASILLARWMGPEGYGVYATAMALVMLLTVPTGLGLPMLVVRLLASYSLHEQWGLMRGLLVRGNQVVLGASLIMMLIVAAAIWGLGGWLSLTNQAVYLLALTIVPLTALGAMRSAALRGLHHVILGQLPESLVVPGFFTLFLLAWHVTGARLSPQNAIGLQISAFSVAFIVGTALLLSRLPSQMRQATPRYETATWARSALPLLFLGGMNIINTQADVLMLAAIQGPESAGVYRAAARGADLVVFSLLVVNMAVQPTIAHLYAAGEMKKLQRIITIAARGAFSASLPVALVLAWFGQPILSGVYGEGFEDGAACLAILCGAQVINAAAGPAALILNMTAHERDSALGVAIAAIVNIVSNATLIPIWGIEGAAFATGLSLVTWNIVLVVYVRRRTGLSSTAAGNFFGRLRGDDQW